MLAATAWMIHLVWVGVSASTKKSIAKMPIMTCTIETFWQKAARSSPSNHGVHFVVAICKQDSEGGEALAVVDLSVPTRHWSGNKLV